MRAPSRWNTQFPMRMASLGASWLNEKPVPRQLLLTAPGLSS